MALTATMYNVSIEVSDVDRGVYQTLDLRLAMHPSETAEYMATRLLAYCLEWEGGDRVHRRTLEWRRAGDRGA